LVSLLPAADSLALHAPTVRPAVPLIRAPARPALDRASANMLLPAQTVTALGVNSAIAALGTAKGQKVLTPSGLVHGWALGVMLWGALGLQTLALTLPGSADGLPAPAALPSARYERPSPTV